MKTNAMNHLLSQHQRPGGALALLLTASLVMTGCVTTPTKDSEDEAPETPVEVTETAPEPSAPTARTLNDITNLIQNGEMEQARRALDAYRERHPRDPTAARLLEQLRADPQAFLGAAHRDYTVQPGDSLSRLASQHLGDPLLFVILARYNDIPRPGSLHVGQTLKLPTEFGAQPAAREPAIEPPQRLAALDAPAAPPPPRPDPAPSHDTEPAVTGDQYRQRLEQLVSAGQWRQADAQLAAAEAAAPGDGGWESWLAPLRERIQAQGWQRRGQEFENRNDPEQALNAYARALSIAPGLEPARTRHATLRRDLVNQYHEAAVVHYRNQQLQEAIDLWDRALRLDPDFEPAQGFRLRARELQRRLEALETAS